jgi:hypothetical protein
MDQYSVSQSAERDCLIFVLLALGFDQQEEIFIRHAPADRCFIFFPSVN